MNILMVIATFVFLIAAWAMTSTCDYNLQNERKVDQLNQDVKELGLNVEETKVIYGKKLDCENFEYRVDFQNLIKNLTVIQKIVQKEIENRIAGKIVANTEDDYKEFLQLSDEKKLNQFKSAEELLEIQNNIKKK